MNNIEKMEDLKSKYCNDTMNGNIWIAYFMESVIQEFKNLSNHIDKLKKNNIKREYINEYIEPFDLKGVDDIKVGGTD